MRAQGHGARGTCCVVLEGKQRVVMDAVGAVCDSIVYDHDLSVSRSRNPALHDVLTSSRAVRRTESVSERYAAPSQSSGRLIRWAEVVFMEVVFMVLWWV